MIFNQREEICPVCGVSGRVTRKWVVNKYGRRYDYYIYHHQGYTHYSNQTTENPRKFKKGELEKILIEKINSQDFKLGSFQIAELQKLLEGEYTNVGFGSIKASLNKLAEIGIIEKQKKGRNLFFVNTVSKERLSFIIDSIKVALEDTNSDATFGRHVFVYRVTNDHSWPLYFIPFRAVGDSDTTFEEFGLNAIDQSNSKGIKVILVEDAPKDKRVLLKLPSPLFPGELRDIRIEYFWAEPKQMFVFSAATKVKMFEFSISGNGRTRLSVSLTSASNNETRELSSEVRGSRSSEWESVQSISLRDVESFAVLQLKWKQI